MNQKSNFMGLSGFVWWIGVVENRKDPLNLGRCQIRIFGWHTENLQLIPSEDLPWAQPLLPVNSYRDFTTPKEGQYVVGFFFDGDSGQFPAYFGVLPGIPKESAIQTNAPTTGFNDLRSTTELTFAPNIPISVTAPTDGSGATVTNQPDKRFPGIAGIPTTSPLAINDPTNPPAQITQRITNVINDIPGPKTESLGPKMAAAAQGAAQALKGTLPSLLKMVPSVDTLKSSILIDGKSLDSILSSNTTSNVASLLTISNDKINFVYEQIQSKTDLLMKAADDASKKATDAANQSIETLSGQTGNITDKITNILNGIVPTTTETKNKVVVDNNVPKVVTPSTAQYETLPNKVPDNVTIQTVDSSKLKSKENAITAYKEMMLRVTEETVSILNKITNRADIDTVGASAVSNYMNKLNKKDEISGTYGDGQVMQDLNTFTSPLTKKVLAAIESATNRTS